MNKDEIKKIIEEFLNKMSVTFEKVDIIEENSSLPRFLITSEDSRILIGTKGEHLSAMNYLLKRILGKKYGAENIKISLDVNNYMENALRDIRNKALILAERARSFKTSVEMDPMNPYERMVIHSLFEEGGDIVTESRGTGENRHVVIKYKEK